MANFSIYFYVSCGCWIYLFIFSFESESLFIFWTNYILLLFFFWKFEILFFSPRSLLLLFRLIFFFFRFLLPLNSSRDFFLPSPILLNLDLRLYFYDWISVFLFRPYLRLMRSMFFILLFLFFNFVLILLIVGYFLLFKLIHMIFFLGDLQLRAVFFVLLILELRKINYEKIRSATSSKLKSSSMNLNKISNVSRVSQVVDDIQSSYLKKFYGNIL